MYFKDILDDSGSIIPLPDQKHLLSFASSLDQMGYFPKEVFDIITNNNHFNLFVPEERGGLNYSLLRGMRLIETYARIEGNIGWIVQIGAGGGVFSAYLSDQVSNKFFGHYSQVIAGSDFVGGKAIPTQDGYRVSGEWKYASGSLHATAFTCNCLITSGTEKGRIKSIIVPADQVRVTKDWDTMGLRATDSHSFKIHDVFVPHNHAFVLGPENLMIENRLLKIPFLLFARALFTPVLIGIAFRYIFLLQNYFFKRKYQENFPGWTPFRHLEQAWTACRKNLYQLAKVVWESSEGQNIDKEQEELFSHACIQIVEDLMQSIDLCHRYTGMEGVTMMSPINVAYRNFKTASAHILLSPSSLNS